jgi:cell division protease FtsH
MTSQATDIATNMIAGGDERGPGTQAMPLRKCVQCRQQHLSDQRATTPPTHRPSDILLTACYNQAIAILEAEKIFLKSLSEILIQVETIDSEEFDIIYQCSVVKKAQSEETMAEGECENCPAKGHCLHYKEQH